jgi:hypothetical protein
MVTRPGFRIIKNIATTQDVMRDQGNILLIIFNRAGFPRQTRASGNIVSRTLQETGHLHGCASVRNSTALNGTMKSSIAPLPAIQSW